MRECQEKLNDSFCRCKRIFEETGKTATVQRNVCAMCNDNGAAVIKQTLRARIISPNTELKVWAEKMKQLAGIEDVKEAMLVAVKQGNRTAEEVIKTADELGLGD